MNLLNIKEAIELIPQGYQILYRIDVDGNVIEESIDYIGTLRANATWKYEALIMSDNADRFELAEITNW